MTAIVKWKYQSMRVSFAQDNTAINNMGSDGWELISVVAVTSGLMLFFKKQVPLTTKE